MTIARKHPAWRSWYKTARWQRLRLKVLQRDGYGCHDTGVMVDHIVPHHGNPDLFWDEGNLQVRPVHRPGS